MTQRAKPGITAYPLGSAGFEEAQERAHRLRGLPFDPHDFEAKKELPQALDGVDDVSVLHRLQQFDTRITAAGAYERRIDKIINRDAEE